MTRPMRLMERLDAFMARANAAYYATHDPFADFTTAPEISQVFGEVLGLWAAVAWQLLGAPDPVLLAEAGPGRGTLMADALRAIGQAAPDFRAALRLHLIETSPRLRALAGGAPARGDLARWAGRRCRTARCCCWPTSSSTRCRSASSSAAATAGPSGSSAPRGLVEQQCVVASAGKDWSDRDAAEGEIVEVREPARAFVADVAARG